MLHRKLTVIVGTLQEPQRTVALNDLRANELALAVGKLEGQTLSEDGRRKLEWNIERKREDIEELYGEGFRK